MRIVPCPTPYPSRSFPEGVQKQAIMIARIMEVEERKVRTTMPRHLEGEIFRRPKSKRKVHQRRGKQRQPQDAEGSGDERTKGRDADRPAFPWAGHLITVQAGDNRCRLPRNVYQDRGGGRPAVHGAVVDTGQHDDGGDRGDVEGGGQERRDMAAVGPRPGRTPTRVPIRHPIKQ